MRQLRNCTSAELYTGTSKCQVNFENVKGAILVPPGTKLPAELTAEKLEELVHAELSARVYGVKDFVEYAKNGGEVQTSAQGYGPEEITGVSARKDTFTMKRFDPELDATFTALGNKAWDVYFFDDDNMLYGMNDGTDQLAGYPMSNVYTDSTPFNTSSAKAALSITFSHENAKRAKTQFDYRRLDFNPQKCVLGLSPVIMQKTTDGGSAYKIYERIGGYDVTGIYGPLIASAGAVVLNGATTAATYNETADTITIATTGSAEVSLKSPKVLFQNDIKGIIQVKA